MDFSFDGKRALVTGAGRGIGREIVKQLVKHGADVVALSRTKGHLLTLKEECPGITIVDVDVGNWEETKIAVEKIGPIDLLVNNAGISGCNHAFGKITEADFTNVININLKGALNVAQIVSKGMKERNTGGVIVNMSSMASTVALPNSTVYGIAKSGMDQMSKVMAVELGPHKIRVNTVNAGFVDTEMLSPVTSNEHLLQYFLSKVPLNKLCQPTDIADVVVFLLSDKASMIHGANIFVDGGRAL